MEKKTNALTILRALKGPPLTLLHAMLLAGQPVTQAWLSFAVGYDGKTVRKHLRYLLEIGYVELVAPHGWTLPDGRLCLPGFELLLVPVRLEAGPDAGAEILPFAGDSPSISPTTTVCKRYKEKESSSRQKADDETVPISDELAQALSDAGIWRSQWQDLARLEHVDATYVRAQRARVMAHPDPHKRSTSFLMHVLRSGDPMPEYCPTCEGLYGQHAADCRDGYRRYTSGKYGDLFENPK